MTEPKTGTKAKCAHCSEAIEYVSGPPCVQWVHMAPWENRFEVFCKLTRATPPAEPKPKIEHHLCPWCPCCRAFHQYPIGEKQDNGKLIKECPRNPHPEPPPRKPHRSGTLDGNYS